MSTTEALLGNLTEMPVINVCYCFQIITKVMVLQKNISAWRRLRTRHCVTGGACKEFSGAILKRQTAAIV